MLEFEVLSLGNRDSEREGKEFCTCFFVHLAPPCHVMQEKSEFEMSLLPIEFNVVVIIARSC